MVYKEFLQLFSFAFRHNIVSIHAYTLIMLFGVFSASAACQYDRSVSCLLSPAAYLQPQVCILFVVINTI